MEELVLKLTEFLDCVGELKAYSNQSNYGLFYSQGTLIIFEYGSDEYNHRFSKDIFRGSLYEFKRFGHKFTELKDILPKFKFYNHIC